jgi:peptidoglycan/xylan/chitin deacetylase (PgdA/CDA1 family)
MAVVLETPVPAGTRASENLTRDFIGYGPTPPHAGWPGEARVAVNFVLNYEEGSEYSIADGDGRSEKTLTEVSSARVPEGQRDLSAEGMYEYGSRAGIWRVARQFTERALPLTVFGCAVAFERNPHVARLVRDSGWDVCCHGYRWTEHYLLDPQAEKTAIRKAVQSLIRTIGTRPMGWYCRYAPSEHTRRLLVEEGGFLYDSDSYADDLPFWVRVGGTGHLVVPYSLVTNDVKVLGGTLTAQAFFEMLRDAFDVLVEEGRTAPKMMSVGIHPRLLGHPARIGGLSRFLDHVAASGAAWICRRGDIATHWRQRFPYPG